MIKIDVISGFLGAGKTTLIKKLFKSAFANEKVVLIENEFGEIGIDSSFLKESGITIIFSNITTPYIIIYDIKIYYPNLSLVYHKLFSL